ncbi:MAG: hypothetical protein RIC35_24075 [Marinoscillum sp.]
MKNSVKTILGALMLTLFVSSAALAQTGTPVTADEQEIPQQQKQEITAEELPDPVADAIVTSDYAEWEINEAYMVSESNEITYEVTFVNPQGQTETETYDKNGKVIDA